MELAADGPANVGAGRSAGMPAAPRGVCADAPTCGSRLAQGRVGAADCDFRMAPKEGDSATFASLRPLELGFDVVVSFN